MAGGRGTRLWPVSRKNKPKQFQKIASDRTMLQDTYARLLQKFAQEDIYVATNEDYVEEVLEELPDMTKDRVIAETAMRDTASCIALACAVISAEDSEAQVSFFPADAVIQNPEVLMIGIDVASDFLTQNPSHIVTFGIMPTQPEIGYGYIKKGDTLVESQGLTVYHVDRFVEKPDFDRAKEYLQSGQYYWNAGMFVFRVDHMIENFKKFVPDTHKRIESIRSAVGTQVYDEVLRREYAEMDKISVDYAIMENVEDIAVLPLSLAWSDVGSWAALKDTLIEQKEEHLVRGDHIDFDSKNMVVYGNDKPVVTIGTQDLIIVDTDDVVLVCARDHAAHLSKAVKQLEEGVYDHIL